MIKWMASILMILLLPTSLAGTIDPSTPDQKHIDYAKDFHSVVQIEGRCCCGEGDEHFFHASAVAISPNWALTAAHVVHGNDNVKIRIGNKLFDAKKVTPHKDFKSEKVGYFDIAICECEGDFGLDFYPDLYEDSDELSKIVSISGYGVTGTFSTGANRMDRKRRAGSNIISRLERDVLVCVLSDRKTQLEFIIAPGDSGGGMFIGNKLAGINSFVMAADGKPDSDYGDECAHTRISKFVPWIRENMEKK